MFCRTTRRAELISLLRATHFHGLSTENTGEMIGFTEVRGHISETRSSETNLLFWSEREELNLLRLGSGPSCLPMTYALIDSQSKRESNPHRPRNAGDPIPSELLDRLEPLTGIEPVSHPYQR